MFLSKYDFCWRNIRNSYSRNFRNFTWFVPTYVSDVRHFYELASFYQRFICNFSFMIMPFTDCMKKCNFIWIAEVEKSFNLIKTKTMSAHILALPNFDKIFDIDCDASHVGIGYVLSHEGRLVTFSMKN